MCTNWKAKSHWSFRPEAKNCMPMTIPVLTFPCSWSEGPDWRLGPLDGQSFHSSRAGRTPSLSGLPQTSQTTIARRSGVLPCWKGWGWGSQVLAIDAARHSGREKDFKYQMTHPAKQDLIRYVVFVVEDILSIKRSIGASIIASGSSRPPSFHILGHKAGRQRCGPLLGNCYKRNVFFALHVMT